jgi:hypothetical protein
MVPIFLLSGNTFAFADDKDILIFNNDYFLDLSSINKSNKNELETITSTKTLNSKSQNVNLRSAHKYLGYTTAALAGITAASFSSKGFHEVLPIFVVHW